MRKARVKGRNKKEPEQEAPPPIPDAGPDMDLRKPKIRENWSVFDPEKTNSMPTTFLPMLLRAMGYFISEDDFYDTILAIAFPDYEPPKKSEPTAEEGSDDTDEAGPPPRPVYPRFIKYSQFETLILTLDDQNLFRMESGHVIAAAFMSIDKENNGWVTVEDLKELMVLGREPFSEQEFKNFLVALNPTEDGKIYYMDYVALMTGGNLPSFGVPSAYPLM